MTLLIAGGASDNSIIEQPRALFFNLDVGGLTKIYTNNPPNYLTMPMSFAYENGRHQEGGMVTFTLLDVTGHQVESAIYNAQQQSTSGGLVNGTFQFGYLGKNPLMSQLYNFQMVDLIPTFDWNSFGVVIVGCVSFMAHTSNNSYSGTPMEILNKMCSNYGWNLSVSPPFGDFNMQDSGYVDVDTTANMPMQIMKWVNEHDWSFLHRLVLLAKDANNMGGYSARLSTQNGQTTLFVSHSVVQGATYNYVCQAPDTQITQFEPHIDFKGSIYGAASTHQNAYSRHNGDEMKTVTDPTVNSNQVAQFPGQTSDPLVQSSPPAPPLAPNIQHYFNSENMPASVTGSVVRNRPGSSNSPYGGTNSFINTSLLEQAACETATLTVLGDPSIDPYGTGKTDQVVNISCYYPKNYYTQPGSAQELYYASGDWFIGGVKQVMSCGQYQTIIDLYRAGSVKPDTTQEPPVSSGPTFSQPSNSDITGLGSNTLLGGGQ